MYYSLYVPRLEKFSKMLKFILISAAFVVCLVKADIYLDEQFPDGKNREIPAKKALELSHLLVIFLWC